MPATVNASEETISIGRIDIRFLLTGEDRYLEPYNRAIKTVSAEMSNLNRFLPALPGGQARIRPCATLPSTASRIGAACRRRSGLSASSYDWQGGGRRAAYQRAEDGDRWRTRPGYE